MWHAGPGRVRVQVMLGQFSEIQNLFDQLLAKLAALKEAYAHDAEALARLKAAEEAARRGAQLARSAANSTKL